MTHKSKLSHLKQLYERVVCWDSLEFYAGLHQLVFWIDIYLVEIEFRNG